jgi:manganese transport protein
MNISHKVNIFKYLGPGILVTVGFIDPGNWAANLSAGSMFGYSLLWMVSLSTLMLILLQHNSAHLGIITGKCLAESASHHISSKFVQPILGSAYIASIATAMAEILGGAIAINMLFNIPVKFSAIILLIIVIITILLNSYHKLEKLIIGFVAIISFCFIYETTLFDINWQQVALSASIPSFPPNSLLIIASVLGAVVMPHNLFLHSEIIQNREWNLADEKIKKKLLNYEFLDTIISMLLGWAINSVIIILAAEVFFKNNIAVDSLPQASELLKPLLGNYAFIMFAIALLFSGFASSITAGMSGGIIYSGMFKRSYNQKSSNTKFGIIFSLAIATLIIIFIDNPLKGLVYSQVLLCMQLPITIFLQIYLTSSKKVMGKYANSAITNILLLSCGIFVSILNVFLLITLLFD